MYSAIVLPFPLSLMFLISTSGNVCSRPTRMPTRFITFRSFHYSCARWPGVRQTSVCRNLSRLDFTPRRIDKLKEPLIKYREAVAPSSPGLPPRLPWVSEFRSASTPMGLCLPSRACTQRSRGGNVGLEVVTASRYKSGIALISMLSPNAIQLDQRFLKFVGPEYPGQSGPMPPPETRQSTLLFEVMS